MDVLLNAAHLEEHLCQVIAQPYAPIRKADDTGSRELGTTRISSCASQVELMTLPFFTLKY